MTRMPRSSRERERAHLDEEPLDGAPEDEVERCWGYEIPVRHRTRPARAEPLP